MAEPLLRFPDVDAWCQFTQVESGVRLKSKKMAKSASPMRFVIYNPHRLPRTSRNHYGIAGPVVAKGNIG